MLITLRDSDTATMLTIALSTTCPRSAFAVFSNGDEAETVTVSVAAPLSSVRSSVSYSFVETRSLRRSSRLNPGCSTVMP